MASRPGQMLLNLAPGLRRKRAVTLPPSSSAVAAPPTAPRRRWVRGLLFLLLGLVLVVGVGLTFLLDPWLRRTLERQVREGSHGRYQLRIAGLQTSLWRGSAVLRGIRLRTVAATPDSAKLPVLRLALPHLRLSGVGLLALLRRQEVPIDSIALDSLTLRLATLPQGGSKQSLHKQLPVPGIRLGTLALRHVRIAYGPEKQPMVRLGESTILAQDVWLSAAGAADSSRIAYAATLAARVHGAAVRVPGHELRLVRAAFTSSSRQLQLDSVLIHPQQPISPTRAPAARLSLALPRLVLGGLDAAGLSRGRFRADTLRVAAPRLALTLPAQAPPSLPEMLRPYLRECRLKHLRVAGGQVRVAGVALAPAVAGVSLSVTDIQVLPDRKTTPDIYYARAWQVRTGPATATLDAPYYHLSWQGLQADSRTGQIRVLNALLMPTLSVAALARRKGHQTAHVTVRLPEISFSGLSFPAATRQQLRAASLVLRRPQVSTRSDGRFRISSAPSLVTPEALRRLPFQLHLGQLRIEQATIRLSYRAPRDPQPGVMSIDRLRVALRNVCTSPAHMSAASPLTGEATGWVQNRCRARLTLRANLLDAAGRHTLAGEFGPAPLSILNSMIVPTRGLALRSGTLHRIRFQMHLDRVAARGTLWGEYSDLKLQLLNQQEKPGLFHRLGTSIINGVFIRDHNPRRPGQPVQPGRMLSAREPRFSVFSLWRQGLVSGMLNSAGGPAGLSKKLSEAK